MAPVTTPLSQLLCEPRDGDAVVAFRDEGAVSWSRFSQDVTALAHLLADSKGERWLVADMDAYAVAVGTFAVLHAEKEVVLPANLQPGHIADLSESTAGLITTDDKLAPISKCLSPFQPARHRFDTRLAALDPERATITLHTSGSTGEPLAITKPLRCFEAEMAAQSQAFEPVPGTLVLATVPAFHIYGLLFRILGPLATGRSFAASMLAYPEMLVSEAERHAGCTLVSSPAFLRRALDVLDLGRLGRHLGPVFSSGGLLPPPVAAAYNAKLAHPIVEVYGSTETGGIATRSVLDAEAPPPWKLLPGIEIAIDPDSKVLAVRSPFLPTSDWFHTGDRAERLSDGRFVLQGRADRIVKIEEERVSLTEVERRLNDNIHVAHARVVPMTEGPSNRQLLAIVVEPSANGWGFLTSRGRTAMRNALLDELRPFVAATVLPRLWRFVSQIPVDDRGKTSESALTALFEPDLGYTVGPAVEHVDRDEGGLSVEIGLHRDLAYFDGHFDGTPLLAGVVQVDWAIKLARQHLSVPGRFSGMEALKFFNILTVGDRVTLRLDYNPDNARLNFEYADGEKRYSSGRISFQTEP